MICVYPADCTDFSTNGNGTLSPLSAEVTETLNGEYELTLVHPIEYSISKCVYIEMFETYGIRKLCRIFCMTDTTSYENLRRHVTFIRHSDLSDGEACHDEIIRRRKPQ